MQGQQVEGVGGDVPSVGSSSAPAISSQEYYTGTEGQTSQPLQQQQQQQQQASSTAAQPSIADVLAAASDRVVERCGYEYNEGLDMFYDANSGLYYHQVSQNA